MNLDHTAAKGTADGDHKRAGMLVCTERGDGSTTDFKPTACAIGLKHSATDELY